MQPELVPGLDDDDGLTRPGAKRVRLWRDRTPEGAFPLLAAAPRHAGACRLCAEYTERLLPFVPQGSQNPKNLLFTDHRKVLNTIYGTNTNPDCTAAASP